ncbi:hypothetical protein [Pusillimonas sp.]|uniref:hypothetical protein n=1 Tax=Pusillimonas sp. TaxID=3040095 RepID=UPI0037C6F25A
MKVNNRPPVELHRLISSALKDKSIVDRMRSDPRSVYESFGVSKREQALLLEDPRNALNHIGVHPNLQFKLLGVLGLLELSIVSVEPYIAQMRKSHGQDS